VLSKRCKYALKALLALARQPAGERMSAARLADEEGLPRQFLDRILLDLNRQGWVDSRRGPKGGHVLAVAPVSITFGAVVRAIDGPLALLPCVSKTAYRRCDDCPDEEACAVRGVFAEVREAASALMDRYTIEQALGGLLTTQPLTARRAAPKKTKRPSAPSVAAKRSTTRAKMRT
jgi:Rrf2 family protein